METTIGTEIDLLDRCPRSKRPIDERGEVITEEVRAVAREYGREFFDGDRLYGYGGYRYDGRWVPVAERFCEYYSLAEDASVLDVGCAKGFLVKDLQVALPKGRVEGVDVSEYAIEHSEPEIKEQLRVACASALPYPDDSFDLVLSINTIHNLPRDLCRQALQEMMRVSRGPAFVTVDAWRDEEGHRRLMKWMLTAETYMSTADWKQFFVEAGYEGDYYWFFA